MKILFWIGGIALAAVAVIFAFRKMQEYAVRNNPRDAADEAANIQSSAKSAQAIASYGDILPPSATNVRMNGGLIDLNQLGGNVPTLWSLPLWSPVLAPNG